MNFTFLGIVCIIIFLILISKYQHRIYVLPTLPLFMFTLSYYRFWGHYDEINIPLDLNLLILFSFLVSIFAYSIGKKIKIAPFDNLYYNLSIVNLKINNSAFFISNKSLRTFLYVSIGYCCFDLWLNTQLYGSLENALIRFYGKPMVSDIPTVFKTMQLYMYKSLVVFIFVYRFFLDKYKKESNYILIITLLLVLIAIPKGSRGVAIAPFMMIITADIFALSFLPNFRWNNNIKEYILIIFTSVVIILTLTVIRDFNYNDAKDLIQAVKDVKLSDASNQLDEGEGDLILRDTKFCFEHYGKEQAYIGFSYTLQNIIYAPVPRAIMPSKKVSFGYVLNESKQGGNSLDPVKLNYPNAVGWAAGVVGEGWANGGLIAVLFYSFIFGLYSGACARMYFLLIKKSTPFSLLLGLLFFQATVSYIRGDILSGFTQGLYPLIILTVLISILRWKIKKGFVLKKT